MFVGRVIGQMWATQKSMSLCGKKMLLVQRLKGVPPQPDKQTIMAICDAIDAGPGDVVLVLDEGSSARSILRDAKAPVRTLIVGIVDHITIENTTYQFT
jgi:ethanolamine utilization protein EutN